jgi:hypothetical protein
MLLHKVVTARRGENECRDQKDYEAWSENLFLAHVYVSFFHPAPTRNMMAICV